MASGDNVDVIEVVETTANFTGATPRPTMDHRPERFNAEDDRESHLPLLPLPPVVSSSRFATPT